MMRKLVDGIQKINSIFKKIKPKPTFCIVGEPNGNETC